MLKARPDSDWFTTAYPITIRLNKKSWLNLTIKKGKLLIVHQENQSS